MKTKIKITLVLTSTLVLGMLLGFFARGYILEHQLEKFQRMQAPGALHDIFLEKIEPTPDQEEELKKILEDYRIKFEEMRFSAMEQMMELKDSLNNELDPILTDEQMDRFERGFFKPPFPPGRGMHKGRGFGKGWQNGRGKYRMNRDTLK